ncbi:hypothetical protein D3C72_2558390 [compost metagenome]
MAIYRPFVAFFDTNRLLVDTRLYLYTHHSRTNTCSAKASAQSQELHRTFATYGKNRQ